MSSNVKYVLITAAVVLGTLYAVQHIQALKDLVYGVSSPKQPAAGNVQ